jgi:membrane-bound lytic murein transglycosylase B
LTVSLLARAFEGGSGLAARWPTEIGSLQRDQILDLQATLNKLGYQSGTPDGMFGANTRRAVRQYQQANAMSADGYPSLALYKDVKAKALALDRAAAQHAAEPLKGSQIVDLQKALIRLGYLKGTADGDVGPKTTAAIERFERSLSLSPLGRATSFVLDEAIKAVKALPPARPARKKRRR